jgi:hypothetical protein
MFTRLLAITFIFVCTSIAWAVLGGTILYRTNSSDDRLRQLGRAANPGNTGT